MLSENKNVIIYGAGGSVGTAVAHAFAKEGATVFLTDHKIEKIRRTVETINTNGGNASFRKVDALDQAEVENYLNELEADNIHIDISFNLISMRDIQGSPLTELHTGEVLITVETALKSHLITALAVARKMKLRRTGVILMLSANAAKAPCENVGGFGIACASLEALSRQLAVELGRYNIRVVCMRSAGSPDAAGLQEVFKQHALLANITPEQFELEFAERTMLKRLPS